MRKYPTIDDDIREPTTETKKPLTNDGESLWEAIIKIGIGGEGAISLLCI
jgi:hypothetical protein